MTAELGAASSPDFSLLYQKLLLSETRGAIAPLLRAVVNALLQAEKAATADLSSESFWVIGGCALLSKAHQVTWR